ncbi:PH domain-containing protein, partial [Kineococcus glutinatus]|uniref:PH domain-containing protein n=1 Tax=Kineococcus glutinatus TaxID=1070872 RepID=UPI0031EF3E9B
LPALLDRYWVPGERLVVAVRRHPVQLAAPVGAVVLAFALLLWITTALPPSVPVVGDVLFLAWFALLARTLWRFVQWRVAWFVVTDRRLLLTRGVLRRKVAMMPVTKVTDMSYNQSLVGRVLDYGQFQMESAGQSQSLRTVSWLPVPDRLYRTICAEVFGADRMPPVGPDAARRRRRRPRG